MTSPPSPKNRRRRRIVVTIAVLVLGLGWYSWRLMLVDQRFVGTWSTTPGADITTDHFASGATIEFDLSDRGSASDANGSDQRFLWRVYNGTMLHLVFVGHADQVLPELRLRLRRSNLIPFYKDSIEYSLGTGEDDLYYDVVSAEENVIQLSGPRGRRVEGREGTLTLRRVIEAP